MGAWIHLLASLLMVASPVYLRAQERVTGHLKTASEASCHLAVKQAGYLAETSPDWKLLKAPGSLHPPAADARETWFAGKGWIKLCLSRDSGRVKVNRDRQFPDQWPKERDYSHAWYLLKADLEPGSEKQIWMRFDAVAHFCAVFVNGKKAGGHIGGYTPFEVEITPFLGPGPDTIAICVQDQSAVVDRERNITISQIGHRKYEMAGIRGGIYFESRRPVHVERIRVKTSTRNRELKVQAWIRGESAKVEIRHEVYRWPEGTAKVLEMPVQSVPVHETEDGGPVEGSMVWEDPDLWSPEHPHLYVLRTTILAGDYSETLDTRFGFREFWIEDRNFMLNGKPIRLLGDSDLRAELLSIVPGRARDYDREALEFLKQSFHYNSIRLHTILFPEWAIQAADEAGYLVINQSSISSGKQRYLNEEFMHHTEAQFAEWYWRDVNSPSVVIWDVENEWIRDHRTPEIERQVLRLDGFIRKFDPEAIIEHSGAAWYHPEQQIIHVHMQEQYSRIIGTWKATGTVPLLLGEFWMGGRGETRLPNGYEYSDRRDWHLEEARLYREHMLEMRYHGVSGIMSHRLTRWPLCDVFKKPLLSPGGPVVKKEHRFKWRFPALRGEGGRGMAPVVGFVWPRGASVTEGEPFSREIVVCNDSENDATFHVTCSYGGESRRWQVRLGPTGQQKKSLKFTPKEEDGEITVSVSNVEGKQLEYDHVSIHPIPRENSVYTPSNRRIVVVPEAAAPISRALDELNVPFEVSEELPVDAARTIVIVPASQSDDALGSTPRSTQEYLSAGGRLLVLPQDRSPRWLPVQMPFWSAVRSSVPEFNRGGWTDKNKDLIYSRELQVYAPGHPGLAGLTGGDFKEWDREDGRIADDVFIRPNALMMDPGCEYRVLLGATRREHASLVEFRSGSGTGMLCQAQVLRLRYHPAARTLFFNLLRYLDGPAWQADVPVVGITGDLTVRQVSDMTRIEENIFTEPGRTGIVPPLVIAGDHSDTGLLAELARKGSTVLVLSCETSARLPGYSVEQGADRIYSGTRSNVSGHPLFWGIYSACFVPLEQTPVKGALSGIPADAEVFMGGHCCGHSPLKNDWTVDIGFWGLETREAAPPLAAIQITGNGNLIATTLEPWDPTSETHQQLLTTLLANAGVQIPVTSSAIRSVEVKRTVPLKFDGLLDDWTNDMEDLNLSKYSHAAPIALSGKDLVKGQVESDFDLSGVVYLLHDNENLYAGGILFSTSGALVLEADICGNLIVIEPGTDCIQVNGRGGENTRIISGRQNAGSLIDTRLLNLTQIHRQTGRSEFMEGTTGVTFEAAVPWNALGYKHPPLQLKGVFRISEQERTIRQPVLQDGEDDHLILKLQN